MGKVCVGIAPGVRPAMPGAGGPRRGYAEHSPPSERRSTGILGPIFPGAGARISRFGRNRRFRPRTTSPPITTPLITTEPLIARDLADVGAGPERLDEAEVLQVVDGLLRVPRLQGQHPRRFVGRLPDDAPIGHVSKQTGLRRGELVPARLQVGSLDALRQVDQLRFEDGAHVLGRRGLNQARGRVRLSRQSKGLVPSVPLRPTPKLKPRLMDARQREGRSVAQHSAAAMSSCAASQYSLVDLPPARQTQCSSRAAMSNRTLPIIVPKSSSIARGGV